MRAAVCMRVGFAPVIVWEENKVKRSLLFKNADVAPSGEVQFLC